MAPGTFSVAPGTFSVAPPVVARSSADAPDASPHLLWELDNSDYLRRVMMQAMLALRPIYGVAVTTGGCTKARDGRGKEIEPSQLDDGSIQIHIEDNIAFYARELGMATHAVEEAAQWLQQARIFMVHSCIQQVPPGFLEHGFSTCERLALSCGSKHAQADLQRLRRQWKEHSEFKSTRRSAGMQAGKGSAMSPGLMTDDAAAVLESIAPTTPPKDDPVTCGERAALAALGEDGCSLEEIQGALWQYGMSAAVAEQACKALAVACWGNSESRARAGAMGLLAQVREALQHHALNEVTEQACAALASMCYDENNAAEAARLGLLAQVQGVLQKHVAWAGVVERACGAMTYMCKGSAANRGEAGRLGLLVDLQAAMRQHSTSSNIILSVGFAVTELCRGDPANQAEARRLGLDESLFILSHHLIEVNAAVRLAKEALVAGGGW